MGRKAIAVLVSEANSGRVFSKAGEVTRAKRNHLSPQLLELLVRVPYNQRAGRFPAFVNAVKAKYTELKSSDSLPFWGGEFGGGRVDICAHVRPPLACTKNCSKKRLSWSVGWHVANLIESVYVYGNDNAKGTNLKTKKNIRIQQIKYECEYSDFAGTNK